MVIVCSLFSCAGEGPPFRATALPPSKRMILPGFERSSPQAPYEINGKRYYPLPHAHGFVEYGKASWYGDAFQGRPTASGDIFDMHKPSAAHKILPLGTLVKVTNLTNDRYTIVRINDRGPFIKERAIDLSYAAAREIDLIGPGVSDVKIVALAEEVGKLVPEGSPSPIPIVEVKDVRRGEFTVQVGAFQDKKNALNLVERLKILYDYVKVDLFVDAEGKTLYRVRVSKSKTLDQATLIENRLEDMGLKGAFIVRIEPLNDAPS